MAREIVIGQSAFDPADAFSPLEKTLALASLVHAVHEAGRQALEAGRTLEELDLPGARRALAAVRDAPEEERETRFQEALGHVARIDPGEAAAPPRRAAADDDEEEAP